ncbi:MAG TPA: nuclear transport factor 2 family protein [Streptomyces sp.]|uniref:nuclear transport factor 2 family protein n=1 Tax=Streptomyces sp. TaxID=1931 RepID=UPI002D70F161|nr:nuclear transport factor 2 family protein [Streptomyces sp.]HZG07176.1 nuclear transport factor 2 family protein [Streptomyces sp.]
MPDEAARKQVALEYCRRLNAGDVDGALALFAAEVTYEDPVGSGPLTGLAAVREHLAQAVANRVRETPGVPVASMDGEHVLLPGRAELDDARLPAGSRLSVNFVAMMRVRADGLIREMRMFWGRSDATVTPTVREAWAAQ